MTPSMPDAPGVPGRATFSRFDQVVWLVILAAAAATGLLVIRGDQVGLDTVSLSPADATARVSTRAAVVAQFDQNVVTPADQVQITLDPPLAGQTQVAGSKVSFVPAQALAPGTTYTVEVAPGITGDKGRTLKEAVTWRFTTRQSQFLFAANGAGAGEGDANQGTSGGTTGASKQLFLAAVPAAGATTADSSPVQITAAPAGIWDFTVAPDGSQIVFSALNQDGGTDLWATPGTGEPALLLACAKSFCTTPAFSPDGRVLAYSRRNPSDFAAAAVSPPRIYMLDMQTKEVAPLLADNQMLGTDPHWSADGKWLAYLAPDRGGVAIFNLDSGAESLYPTLTGEVGAWDTQRSVLMMSEAHEQDGKQIDHLFLVDPVGQTRRDMSGEASLVQDNAPAWSPDGKWIAFRRNELTGARQTLTKQLWIMRADGTDARPLTGDPAVDYSAPSWSPDGRYLIYHKLPLKGPDILRSVWAMDPATGEERQLAGDGLLPLWVP